MKKTTLVVLAAGMGSRYGGLKQIDPIGPKGEIILELSVFDAIRAGFNKVVFVIKKSIEKEFKEAIGNKLSQYIEVEYVYQQLEAYLPQGFEIPQGREKPWGTAHALLCCKDVIKEPFGIINADDYYGVQSFKTLHDFLVESDETTMAMVGFTLSNTLSENGSVSRGICEVENGLLKDVVERKNIERIDGVVKYCLDDTWYPVADDALASMNMWGFNPSFFTYCEEQFNLFLNNEAKDNPLKSECYIPTVVDNGIKANKFSCKMLKSDEKWYGVTYSEDKPSVRAGIQALMDAAVYPDGLWDSLEKGDK